MPVDVEKLRDLSPGLGKFLEFEKELEASIRQEDQLRRQDYQEEKRQREKRARKKRLRKMRQIQQQ
jgi:LPS O-antigen subunit length determinant protein (WzzB/FepE family)